MRHYSLSDGWRSAITIRGKREGKIRCIFESQETQITLMSIYNRYISLTECNNGTIQKFPIWRYYYDWTKNSNNYIRQQWHLAGYASANNCACIAVSSWYIFELNHSINSKWKFLSCTTVACNELYISWKSHITRIAVYGWCLL
jgi:hypothetical protein